MTSTSYTASTSSSPSGLPQYSITEVIYGIPPTNTPTPETLYSANVLLPLQFFNLDHPRYLNRDFRYCPHSNSLPSTLSSTSNTYTNQLTEFGTILMNLVITQFNNTFGKTYNVNQFAIKTAANNQNSICAYEIYSEPLGIIIEVWVEVATIPNVSIKFISAVV